MLLLIDNYDSFTYNLVQYFGELGTEARVLRNDVLSVEQVLAMRPERLVISPGPCTPDQAGISLDLVAAAAEQRLPLLGVCLGHQALVQAFGGHIVRARRVMHGKTSPVHHTNTGLFRDLPQPLIAARYHSLVAEPESLPECFDVTAWCGEPGADDYVIMGVHHHELPIEGVQFHPESIATDAGQQLLRNFLDASRQE